MLSNYTFPLDFSKLTQRKAQHKKCSLEDSIQQHIFLILITRYGANRYADNYGCELWMHDFDSPSAINKRRHQLEKSIRELLLQQETRLEGTVVTINISQEDIPVGKFGTITKTKKKITITIKGRIVETNRVFQPKPFVVYFSPIMLSKD